MFYTSETIEKILRGEEPFDFLDKKMEKKADYMHLTSTIGVSVYKTKGVSENHPYIVFYDEQEEKAVIAIGIPGVKKEDIDVKYTQTEEGIEIEVRAQRRLEDIQEITGVVDKTFKAISDPIVYKVAIYDVNWLYNKVENRPNRTIEPQNIDAIYRDGMLYMIVKLKSNRKQERKVRVSVR